MISVITDRIDVIYDHMYQKITQKMTTDGERYSIMRKNDNPN